MDLFNNTTDTLRQDFYPVLKDWSNILDLNTLVNLNELLKVVRAEYSNHTCYPDKKDIFKVFKETNIEDIKVVILGQDPYYNGNATGRAFGCKVNISPSLKEIFGAIEVDFPLIKERDKELDYLVNQGVFLLNTSLTVRAGTPLSHLSLWNNFTRDVISKIQEKDNVVWMLWGKEAQKYKDSIKNPSNLILESSHPASASYNNTIWKTDNFDRCNEFLKSKNKEEIIWW